MQHKHEQGSGEFAGTNKIAIEVNISDD